MVANIRTANLKSVGATSRRDCGMSRTAWLFQRDAHEYIHVGLWRIIPDAQALLNSYHASSPKDHGRLML